jgi:MYXO-CTERM domain-containing protein
MSKVITAAFVGTAVFASSIAMAAPRAYIGKARLTGTSLEARARTAVGMFAPGARALDLARTDLAALGDGDTIVRFEQTHRGLPVIGRGAAVRLDARGDSVLGSARFEDALPSSIVPGIDAARAATAAQRLSRLEARPEHAHLVVFPSRAHGEGRLAWVVLPTPVPGVALAPRIVVDAQTAQILEARDLVVFAGKSKVYATNPVASPSLIDVTLPVEAGAASLGNAFVQSANCVDKKDVKDLSFSGLPLSVHICDMDHLAAADPSLDFPYPPASDTDPKDPFSEVSMFYHASRAYDFFRTLRGDMGAQVTVDKPLRTISNLQIAHGLLQGDIQKAADPNTALDPFQNAFFSPAGGGLGQIFEQLYGFNAGAMWFGQGPRRDYSYDGDVIYHEFTHAVVDKTLQLGQYHLDAYGLSDAPGAMNEGLADYFSSALAGDPKVGEYASKDISLSLDVIRNLDNTDTCPKTFVGEVHFDSTFFSGGLWSARASLADDATRTKFDAALYKAMMSHAGDGDLGYEDLTKLFLGTLKVDLPAGATALEAEMQKRGVLPQCTRVLEHTKVITAPDGVTSPGDYAAPGTASSGTGSVAPGILQVAKDVPAGTASVTITFTSLQQASGLGFGGQGTPFTPVVLAKFGGPVQWTTSGKLTSNADVTTDAKGNGAKPNQTFTATVDVPDGATRVWLQIANKGSQDGAYNKIDLAFTAKPEAEPPVSDGAGQNTPPPSSSSNSGCACHVPRSSDPTAAGIFAALMVAVAFALRRKRT